jgi:hypothetical protein
MLALLIKKNLVYINNNIQLNSIGESLNRYYIYTLILRILLPSPCAQIGYRIARGISSI